MSYLIRRSRKGGRHAKLWAFGYADMARAFQMKVQAVRDAVSEGKFDPTDLVEVLTFALRVRGGYYGAIK